MKTFVAAAVFALLVTAMCILGGAAEAAEVAQKATQKAAVGPAQKATQKASAAQKGAPRYGRLGRERRQARRMARRA